MYAKILFIISSLFLFQLTALSGNGKTDSLLTPTKGPVNINNYIIASLSGVNHVISNDFFGFNNNTLDGPSWSDGNLISLLKELQPGLIRYPGGTVSDYWDWKNGWLYTQIPFSILAAQGYVQSTLGDLKTAYDNCGFTPVFVLNMISSDLSYQIEFLNQAYKKGLPVKYIELGNEYYRNESYMVDRFPTCTDYLNEVKTWSAKIKSQFPDAKISIVASRPDYDKDQRGKQWNAILFNSLKSLTYVDAISMHPYTGTGIGNNNGNLMDYNDLKSVFNASFSGMHYFDSIPALNKEVWLTEYNLYDINFHLVHSRWADALYTLNQTLSFLNVEEVNMVLNHALTGNTAFNSVFINSDELKDEFNISNTPLDITASGFAMKVVFETTKNMTNAQVINFNLNSMQGPSLEQTDGIIGWLFDNGSSYKAIVINLTNESATLNLSQISKVSFTNYKQYSADPLEIIHDSGLIQTQSVFILQDEISISPYSIVVF